MPLCRSLYLTASFWSLCIAARLCMLVLHGKGRSVVLDAFLLQGTLTTELPIAPNVATRNWLRSCMVVQLLRVCSPVSAVSHSTQQPAGTPDATTSSLHQCIARGTLQPHTLLDGCHKEWSSRLVLLTEKPLFDAKGIRLGMEDSNTACEVNVRVHNILMASLDLQEESLAHAKWHCLAALCLSC